MASSTSGSGAVGGSVLDVSSLVSQLVAAERAPYDARIARETASVSTQISALGSLKGALSTFQTALAPFKGAQSGAARSAVSSDDEVFTATATSKAAAGVYDIEVIKLAKAQQIASTPFLAGATAPVGYGTLTVSLGATSMQVEIAPGKNTLGDIRDAINTASGNPGVRATLVNTTDGSRLVLSSVATGAANTIQVTTAGGDGGLSVLTYGPGNTAGYTSLSPAQDAELEVAGFALKSTTNSVTGAIDGVSLDLLQEEPGTVLTLTVGNDASTVTDRIKAFVASYNALETQAAKLRSYDAASGTAGPLLGDALLNGIESQLRRLITSPVTGANPPYQTLASVGITTLADGTLVINDAKLSAALKADFDGVAGLFSGTNGVATRLDTEISSRLASDGAIETRSGTLVGRQRSLTQQQSDIDARMEKLSARYLKQYSALDNLLSQLQTTSAYLSQQLDNLPKPPASR